MAKGWTVVRMIMTLDVDVTAERRHYNTHRPLKGKRLITFCASLRSGGRRLAVRKMIECHISAQPSTPFPASRDFPSRGNEGYGEKNRASYTSCTIPVYPPLVAGATTFPPLRGGTMGAQQWSHVSAGKHRAIYSVPRRGEVRRSRIRGSRVAANHQNVFHAI